METAPTARACDIITWLRGTMRSNLHLACPTSSSQFTSKPEATPAAADQNYTRVSSTITQRATFAIVCNYRLLSKHNAEALWGH